MQCISKTPLVVALTLAAAPALGQIPGQPYYPAPQSAQPGAPTGSGYGSPAYGGYGAGAVPYGGPPAGYGASPGAYAAPAPGYVAPPAGAPVARASGAQYVYPAQGQDQARQTRDQADCSAWAGQQTGFDPSKASDAGASGSPSSGLTSSLATAALGALPGGLGPAAGLLGGTGGQALSANSLGVAASAIPGLGGAGTSQALGVLNQAMGQKKQSPQGQQQAARPGQADYDQARAACLTGRGYSVR